VLDFTTNIAAMSIYRYLALNTAAANQASARLASGKRINSAADDAAGLAISEGLQSQLGGMTQAVQNAQDGLSVLQTADGGLTETDAILQQMSSLAVQAASTGSQNPDSLAAIQAQLGSLKSELDGIATGTTFDGTRLLDGSYTGQVFQVGADAGQTMTVDIPSASALALGVAGVDVTSAGALYQAGSTVGAGAVTTTDATTSAPATLLFTHQGTDDFSAATGTVASFQDLSGTVSFGGKSFDLSSVDYSGATDPTQALAALNTAAQGALGLTTAPFSASGTDLQFQVTDAVSGYTGTGGAAQSGSATDISNATPAFSTATGAAAAITAIDDAITTVSNDQAVLGGTENAFQFQIDDLNESISNTTVANSNLTDADLALEEINLSQAQILEQTGTAMLAQADQFPQTLFQFLLG